MKKITSFVSSYFFSLLTNSKKRDKFMFALCIMVALTGLGTNYLRSEFEEFWHDITAIYLFISLVVMSFVFAIGFCMIFIQKMKNGNKPK